MPFIVPEHQPLELIFFQRVFRRICEENDLLGQEQPGIPLLVFHRVFSRLFKILEDDRQFNAASYDLNNDGKVRWWEFCMLWKQERPAINLSPWERLYITLEDPSSSQVARLLSIFVLLAIVVSAGSFMLSTLPDMQRYADEAPRGEPQLDPPEPYPVFGVVDAVCVVLFTIEYILRLVSSWHMRPELTNTRTHEDLIETLATEDVVSRATRPRRVLRFATNWANLIDLLAIAPSYIGWIMTAASPEEDGGKSPIFKLIRLMRVVRAIRLCRRLEPVIIIGTAMSRSVGAVQVLVLNVFMHMLVMGAMMFFVEQGEFKPEIATYVRKVDTYTCPAPGQPGRCEQDEDLSPFLSIPHSFWWAVVTATTTGYGDVYPTTELGKIVASIAMVLSLCVLALPVGVIGGHFEEVWSEYDAKNAAEMQRMAGEARMAKRTLRSLEPLSFSKRLFLEVYHDSRIAMPVSDLHKFTPDQNDVFLGEAEFELDLHNSADVVEEELVLALMPRPGHQREGQRSIRGTIYAHYKWTPQESHEPGTMLSGILAVRLARLEGLGDIDWKLMKLADPYVVLTLYPTSPGEDGELRPQVERFPTIFDEACPSWNRTVSVPFNWHKDGVNARREYERRRSKCDLSKGGLSKTATFITDDENAAQCLRRLPSVQDDVRELQRMVKPLERDVQTAKAAARAVVGALGDAAPGRGKGRDAGALDTSQDPSPASPQAPAAAGGPVVSAVTVSPFHVPGSVPESPLTR